MRYYITKLMPKIVAFGAEMMGNCSDLMVTIYKTYCVLTTSTDLDNH